MKLPPATHCSEDPCLLLRLLLGRGPLAERQTGDCRLCLVLQWREAPVLRHTWSVGPGQLGIWGRAATLPRWDFLSVLIAKTGHSSASISKNTVWLAWRVSKLEHLTFLSNQYPLCGKKTLETRVPVLQIKKLGHILHRMCCKSKTKREHQIPRKERSKTWVSLGI